MTLSDRVRGDLAALLGPGLTGERWMRKNRLEVRTKKEHVEKVAHLLTRVFDARLAHVSVVDKGFHGYDVVYHYALDHAERSLHVNVKAELPLDEPEVASVSREAPEASWSEREMMELTPVRFRGHPDPRHLWLPMEWPYPAESGKYEESEVIGRKDETLGKPIEESGGWLPLGVEPKSSEASLVLLGPYHPLLIEAAYFRVKVNGEEIVDADVKLGW
ncbi:MAG: NADH-quinone oxidoreductase subunit C, partial [Candidatus Bathyarchaeia archaeon]